jgi:AcrR family transcriptional regulator
MPPTTSTPTPPARQRAPRERRVSARRQATRERLLEAASEIFAERGFHGASVEDICERAGFTRGAFYSNFSSKDDLVLELSSRQSEALVERVRAASKRERATAQDILRDVFAAISGDSQSREQWFVLTTEFTLHAIRDAAARRSWATQQRRIRDELIAVVDEAVARHGISLPLPTETFVRAAVSLVQGSITQRLVEPRAVAAGELERAVLPLLLGLDPSAA